MAGFDAVDAALEGFRITRERPRAVLAWGLVYVLGVAVIVTLVVALFGAGAFAFLSDESISDAEMLATVAPMALLALPLVLILSAVLTAAVYRVVLEPEAAHRAYLRLGADEFRLLAVMLLVAVGIVLASLVSLLVLTAVARALPAGARGLLVFLGVLFILGSAIWLGVRLSLVAPATLANRRIDFREGWRLSAGRFWPLFGAYVLAIVMTILIAILSAIIATAVLVLLGGGLNAIGKANRFDFSDLGAGLAIGLFLNFAIQIVAAVLQLVVQTAPAAVAYRELSRGDPAAS